jgi:hypothetical protein
MRFALLLGVLLVAATASAQPKVWTNADLAKPLPQLQREPEPAALAAMKARADYIPNVGGGAAAREPFAEPARPVDFFTRESERIRAAEAAQPVFYAAQPLYPFVSVVYSNRPYLRPAVRPCPVPPVFRRR